MSALTVPQHMVDALHRTEAEETARLEALIHEFSDAVVLPYEVEVGTRSGHVTAEYADRRTWDLVVASAKALLDQYPADLEYAVWALDDEGTIYPVGSSDTVQDVWVRYGGKVVAKF